MFPKLENVKKLFQEYTSIGWLVRETMAKCNDYKTAFDKLCRDELTDKAYITIIGTKDNEGAVITRNKTKADCVDTLSADKWYLV